MEALCLLLLSLRLDQPSWLSVDELASSYRYLWLLLQRNFVTFEDGGRSLCKLNRFTMNDEYDRDWDTITSWIISQNSISKIRQCLENGRKVPHKNGSLSRASHNRVIKLLMGCNYFVWNHKVVYSLSLSPQ